MNKKMLVREYPSHAGSWIYNGFASAWEELGYDVERWDKLQDHKVENSHIMMATSDIVVKDEFQDELIEFLKLPEKAYIFVSPIKFPDPWGQHVNFIDHTAKKPELIEKFKSLDNVVFWTFCDVSKAPEFWEDWGEVHSVPLGFDNINYERMYDKKYEFDVCYVGGRADNGFDTKYQIMKEYFSAFKDSRLKCGFFIDKNLTHEQECKVLTSSHICLNIHDEYQHELGLDTNERTWKTLGLNGLLVSDYVGDVIPDYVYQCKSPEEMVAETQELLKDYPLAQKKKNSSDVIENHTYVERCKQMEKL